jgi:glycosyltransferase involved in cell wall biosynthesis
VTGHVARGERRPPHVVMVVANDVRRDTRVRKSALAVASLGVEVTVVGVTTAPRRWDTTLDVPQPWGRVRIIRVPVDFLLSQTRKDRRARLHRGEFPLLTTDPGAEALARRRLAAAELDASARQGPGGSVRRAVVDARRLALRAEGAGRRKAARGARLGFKAWDKLWQTCPVAASPHRVVPEVDDLELAVGPVLDALAPDVIHAHDVHLLGVVARSVARAREGGRRVAWLYDAHEWVPGLSRYGGRTPRVIAAWAALERRFIGEADAVITVSPPLAEALRERYHLPRRPQVVLNVPPLGAGDTGARSVRQESGVPDGVPLLVYSGGVQAARGVETAVEALVHLPEAHLAVVAVPSVNSAPVAAVRARAAQLGVEPRLHVLPPVAPDQVSAFLTGADVGLIPLRHYGSHEMALANKLFEYLHAGVPMVVSDCRAQTAFVTEHRVGEVHAAGDGADLAAAVTRVLTSRERYLTALADPALLQRYTWHTQATVLRDVHRRLIGAVRPDVALPADPEQDPAAEPTERLVAGCWPADAVEPGGAEEPGVADRAEPAGPRPAVLAIGPANSAGQGWAWARAAERHLDGVSGHVVAVRNNVYDYPADVLISRERYRNDVAWQLRELADARSRWTHALFEAGRPLLGGLAGRDFTGDAELLRAAGVETGLVLHGSETRDPRRHRGREEFSPFADPRDALTKKLQTRVDLLLPAVTAFADGGGTVFVSTPDQLADVPGATWLPVVVDARRWAGEGEILTRDVPLFVHAPSHPALKGSARVEEVLRPLADRGLIDFELVTGLPPAEAAGRVAAADVVVDQLLLGLYGVLACEAMAGGRLVLGHLGETLRSRVDRPVPVVEATPRSLAEVVERILDDREWARAQALAGPEFVQTLHDGRRSAAVLAPFLGRPTPAGASSPGHIPAEVTAR